MTIDQMGISQAASGLSEDFGWYGDREKAWMSTFRDRLQEYLETLAGQPVSLDPVQLGMVG